MSLALAPTLCAGALADDRDREQIVVGHALFQRVPNVVLCGNANRARQYHAAKGRTNGGGGDFNYFASVEGMIAVLEARGYTIVRVVAQGDPIVVGAKAIHPRA